MALQTAIPSIVITPGEPAGIGPDITIALAQQSHSAELIIIADPDVLLARAQQLHLPLKLIDYQADSEPTLSPSGTLKIIPVKTKNKVIPQQLNPANSGYVLETLQLATNLCLQHHAQAIVTGPVHKGIINDGGYLFRGHTEYFAQLCEIPQTVMLFVVPQLKSSTSVIGSPLKVALTTTHIPLAKVSSCITTQKLSDVISILHHALRQQFKIEDPRILICGLNPHAGEGGHLGREEIDIIIPTIQQLRQQYQMNIKGPLPADTIFTPAYLSQADVVLAQYHDQALPLVKYLSFGQAVNVTLGLPFIRTSVDHGTALDVAGTGRADANSLFAALSVALNLCSASPHK